MKKQTSFEIAYQALERIEYREIDDDAVAELKRAISGQTSLLVSKAAEIAGRNTLRDLIPDMVSAFSRFLINGENTDKQCAAKISIANALNTLEHMGDEVFLAGARYSQIEGSFGRIPVVDTAIPLRCACAFGIARIIHPQAHYVLTELLVDPLYGVRQTDPDIDAEYEVRAAAAKALAYIGTPEAEVLLRLKVLAGETNPAVVSECFTGLLVMAPERSMEFVARYLRLPNPVVAECAALAIGNSHAPRAFETLQQWWDESLSPAVRRMLLTPIALVRNDDALGFLLEVLRGGDSRMAAEALSALRLYADDESHRGIREALRARGDKELIERFERESRI